MEAQRFLFGRPAVRMDPFNSGNLLGVKLPQQRRFLFFFFLADAGSCSIRKRKRAFSVEGSVLTSAGMGGVWSRRRLGLTVSLVWGSDRNVFSYQVCIACLECVS